MPFDLTLESITTFTKAHQSLAPLVVFMLAMGETIVVVSLFIPSTLILFGLGGLFAASGVPLAPCIIAGALGAGIGFSLSYLLGATFQGRILGLWPLRNYPDALQKATEFSRRWGALGVLMGHFAGPLRPLIPIVAGITRMPPFQFMIANLIGGLGWILVFLTPGYLVITSEAYRTSFEAMKKLF
jgi:membrane protein DedA with SNARE-associated domain